MTWPTYRLGEVIESYQSGFACGNKGVADGFKHLRMNNIHADGRLDLSLVRTVPPELATERYRLQPDDILVCTTNSGKLVGKSAMFRMAGDYAFSNHLTRLRMRGDIADPTFVQKQLWFKWMHGEIEPLCKHWVNQSTLPKEELLDLEISLPDVEEQRRVSRVLDHISACLDDTRARLDTIPAILKRFRMSVLEAACTGRLTEQWRADNSAPPSIESRLRSMKSARLAACPKRDQEAIDAAFESHEQPDGLPAGWLQLPARLCCHFITKGTTPKDVTHVGEVPFLKVHHIVDNSISFEPKPAFVPQSTHIGILARSKVFPGDVVMNIVGPPLNKVAIIPATYAEWNINQALAIFRPIGGLKSDFLAHLLSLESTLKDVLEETRGSAGQSNISLEQCRNVPVLVPPEQEQAEILRRVNMLFTQADTIEARYRKARRFSDKLMPSVLAKAFRGELV